jgi:ribosomal protein S18 acetylase RimI-like enzyme
MTVRPISLREVRKFGPIDSGFQTDRVLRLHREERGGETLWRLREERLSAPYTKQYDSGDVDEWLRLYADAADIEKFSFALASLDGKPQGLLTWRGMGWNDTLWLVDIRVRPCARRRGVGAALVDFLKQVAAHQQVRGIAVETQINNYPALRFYRKQGFEIVGINDHLYANDDLQRQDVAIFLFWEAE